MLFALDICVNKKAPPTQPLPPLQPQKHYPFFFSFFPSPLLNLQTIQAPFWQFNPSPILKKRFFRAPPPLKIGFSVILKL